MKFYMARVAKISLIVIVASFLFFKSAGKRSALADSDHDGLIEIKNATMLNNIRYNLAGTSYKTSARDAGNTDGCPAVVNGSGGCNGYELMADIDLLSLLDTNGNGSIDTTMEGIDKNADGDTTDTGEQIIVIDTKTGQDTSWVPIGDNSARTNTSRFTSTFEGNNHTIANLWVNITSSAASDIYAGLFGVTGGVAIIRNVGVISGSIHSSVHSNDKSASSPYSGGLVGWSFNRLMITNSYFSGSGGVSSSSGSTSFSGGLVGRSYNITIMNSYFSGGGSVSSSSDFASYSGGLVGYGRRILTITNSYFSGSGGVSSSSTGKSSDSSHVDSSTSFSGGLVGGGTVVTIINSYFSGSGGVSSKSSKTSRPSYSYSFSGGLVGSSYFSATITNSYFSGSGDVSSSSSSGGLVGHGRHILTITNSYFSGGGGVLLLLLLLLGLLQAVWWVRVLLRVLQIVIGTQTHLKV